MEQVSYFMKRTPKIRLAPSPLYLCVLFPIF